MFFLTCKSRRRLTKHGSLSRPHTFQTERVSGGCDPGSSLFICFPRPAPKHKINSLSGPHMLIKHVVGALTWPPDERFIHHAAPWHLVKVLLFHGDAVSDQIQLQESWIWSDIIHIITMMIIFKRVSLPSVPSGSIDLLRRAQPLLNLTIKLKVTFFWDKTFKWPTKKKIYCLHRQNEHEPLYQNLKPFGLRIHGFMWNLFDLLEPYRKVLVIKNRNTAGRIERVNYYN